MSMIIDVPIIKRVLDDYDLVYANGMVLPLTIDLLGGDTIEIGEKTIQVNLVAKPSQNDPTKTLPAEDITIFTDKVASIQHRSREVVEQTLEEKTAWHRTFQELSGGSTAIN